MVLEEVAWALDGFGLCLRGGFKLGEGDDASPLADGRQACTVVMVGNVGAAMWRSFAQQRPASADPLDAWSRTALHQVAKQFGGRAVFPFERPYLPFQQWLMRAEPCHPSPLGILIHPEYGLWHALRGALLFAEEIEPPAMKGHPSPCEACRDRPCRNTCPVTAFTDMGYDVPRCVAHLNSPAGEDCMALGCRARRICPIGASYRYGSPQARFHMEAFRSAYSAGPRGMG